MANQSENFLTRQLIDRFYHLTDQYKEGWVYRGRPLKFEPRVGQRQHCLRFKKDFGVLKDALFIEIINQHGVRGEALIWDDNQKSTRVRYSYSGDKPFTKLLNDVLKQPAKQIPILPKDSLSDTSAS